MPDIVKGSIVAFLILLLGALGGYNIFRLYHECPDVSHVECRIGAAFEAGKLFRANVAFSDAVDQYNECNKALMLCEGWLPPINGEVK